MDFLIGTPQCPHLGFAARDGRPCCHADDATRIACGKWAPNPSARGQSGRESNVAGVDPYYCTVLGTETLPRQALQLAAQEKARAARGDGAGRPSYRPPAEVTGSRAAPPSRGQDDDADQPVIPTHTLRAEERKVGPNDKCPCGSGRKFKKCCGRGGGR